MTAAVELAMLEWAEGERRLAELETDRRAPGGSWSRPWSTSSTREIVRRVGQPSTSAALGDVYASSEPWCLDVAQRVTDETVGHDLSIVQPAAFARVARDAIDYR